jgi:hypothetical protein
MRHLARLGWATGLLALFGLGNVARSERVVGPPTPLHHLISMDVPEPAMQPSVADGPCDQGRTELATVVRQTARLLSEQRVRYNSQPQSDCSGMFHRVLSVLERRCSGIEAPTMDVARSSHALAHWYDDRGLLTRVERPEDADPWIVPGAAMFYGYTSRGRGLDGVVHVGIVVDVTRDDDGRVLSYRLFHARSTGTVAGITGWHERSRRPPLGNGPDPLVGIAFVDRDLPMEGIAAAFHDIDDSAGDPWSDFEAGE